MKLNTKFIIGMTSIVTLSVIGVGGITIYSQQKQLRNEIITHHQQLTQQLARISEEALYQSDLVFFNFEKELKKERGYQEAAFTDKNGLIQVHSDPYRRLQTLAKPNSDLSLHYSAPVLYSGEPAGTAHLLISKPVLESYFRNSLLNDVRRIGFITLVFLLIAILMAVLFARAMVKPIQDVIGGMKQVSEGKLEPIAFPKRNDELGWMGKQLNVTIHQLKEVDEMKRDFVASVTHDLKSPLKGIQSIFTLLSKDRKNLSEDRLEEYLISGKNNASRLMAMIDDLLTTAHIEAGGKDVEYKLFDVGPVIKEIVDVYRPIFAEKKLALKFESPAKPVYVYADPEKTQHVLLNLVSNGFKYTDNGFVQIVATDESDLVHIMVKDSGKGIPLQDQSKIFGKFYRSPSNKKAAKGTGLGLFIAKSFTEQQGGELKVQSNPTGGSIFILSLLKDKK